MYHNLQHTRLEMVTVSQDIKDFIKENIDLLSWEIYTQLINKGLDISIRQKQIYFW